MRAHEAGALHGNDIAPTWLPYPDDVNHLIDGLWSKETRRAKNGELTIANVGVSEIVNTYGSPVLVVDEEDFRTRAREFKSSFEAAFSQLNGAEISYAAKAFISIKLATLIDAEGLGLDVCSGGELAVALKAGFEAQKITFHGNNKSDHEIRAALKAGVGKIVIDSLDEIQQIEDLAAQLQTQQDVLIRLTTGVEAHTHEFIATAHEDQKFGISIASGQALAAVKAVTATKYLKLIGLHSHIGSQIFETDGFEVAARRMLKFYKTASQEAETLKLIVLGGGFGVKYNSQHTPKTPSELALELAEIIKAGATEFKIDPPKVAFEPGRAIAAPSTQTIYSVGSIKRVELGAEQSRLYVSVDGGMSDNIRTALYDADYSCLLANRISAARPTVVRVVGKHCESGDIVVKDEYLPADLKRHDLISVPVTGAYCYALASNYNHITRPAVVAVKNGVITPLIRRETIDDLLARDLGD